MFTCRGSRYSQHYNGSKGKVPKHHQQKTYIAGQSCPCSHFSAHGIFASQVALRLHRLNSHRECHGWKVVCEVHKAPLAWPGLKEVRIFANGFLYGPQSLYFPICFNKTLCFSWSGNLGIAKSLFVLLPRQNTANFQGTATCSSQNRKPTHLLWKVSMADSAGLFTHNVATLIHLHFIYSGNLGGIGMRTLHPPFEVTCTFTSVRRLEIPGQNGNES